MTRPPVVVTTPTAPPTIRTFPPVSFTFPPFVIGSPTRPPTRPPVWTFPPFVVTRPPFTVVTSPPIALPPIGLPPVGLPPVDVVTVPPAFITFPPLFTRPPTRAPYWTFPPIMTRPPVHFTRPPTTDAPTQRPVFTFPPFVTAPPFHITRPPISITLPPFSFTRPPTYPTRPPYFTFAPFITRPPDIVLPPTFATRPPTLPPFDFTLPPVIRPTGPPVDMTLPPLWDTLQPFQVITGPPLDIITRPPISPPTAMPTAAPTTPCDVSVQLYNTQRGFLFRPTRGNGVWLRRCPSNPGTRCFEELPCEGQVPDQDLSLYPYCVIKVNCSVVTSTDREVAPGTVPVSQGYCLNYRRCSPISTRDPTPAPTARPTRFTLPPGIVYPPVPIFTRPPTAAPTMPPTPPCEGAKKLSLASYGFRYVPTNGSGVWLRRCPSMPGVRCFVELPCEGDLSRTLSTSDQMLSIFQECQVRERCYPQVDATGAASASSACWQYEDCPVPTRPPTIGTFPPVSLTLAPYTTAPITTRPPIRPPTNPPTLPPTVPCEATVQIVDDVTGFTFRPTKGDGVWLRQCSSMTDGTPCYEERPCTGMVPTLAGFSLFGRFCMAKTRCDVREEIAAGIDTEMCSNYTSCRPTRPPTRAPTRAPYTRPPFATFPPVSISFPPVPIFTRPPTAAPTMAPTAPCEGEQFTLGTAQYGFRYRVTKQTGVWLRQCPNSITSRPCFTEEPCNFTVPAGMESESMFGRACLVRQRCRPLSDTDNSTSCFTYEECPTAAPTAPAPTAAAPTPCDSAVQLADVDVGGWYMQRATTSGWFLRPCEEEPHCFVFTRCNASVMFDYTTVGSPWSYCGLPASCPRDGAPPLDDRARCIMHSPCRPTRPPTRPPTSMPTRPPTSMAPTTPAPTRPCENAFRIVNATVDDQVGWTPQRTDAHGFYLRPCNGTDCYYPVSCRGDTTPVIDYTTLGSPFSFCANRITCRPDPTSTRPCWTNMECLPTRPPTRAPTRPPVTKAPTTGPTDSPCNNSIRLSEVDEEGWFFQRATSTGYWLRPCLSSVDCFDPVPCDASDDREYTSMGAPYPYCAIRVNCTAAQGPPAGQRCLIHSPCYSTEPPTRPPTRPPTQEPTQQPTTPPTRPCDASIMLTSAEDEGWYVVPAEQSGFWLRPCVSTLPGMQSCYDPTPCEGGDGVNYTMLGAPFELCSERVACSRTNPPPRGTDCIRHQPCLPTRAPTTMAPVTRPPTTTPPTTDAPTYAPTEPCDDTYEIAQVDEGGWFFQRTDQQGWWLRPCFGSSRRCYERVECDGSLGVSYSAFGAPYPWCATFENCTAGSTATQPCMMHYPCQTQPPTTAAPVTRAPTTPPPTAPPTEPCESTYMLETVSEAGWFFDRTDLMGWWFRPCPSSVDKRCYEKVQCDGRQDVDYTSMGAPYAHCALLTNCTSSTMPSDGTRCIMDRPCRTQAPTRPPYTMAPTTPAPTQPCGDSYSINQVEPGAVRGWRFVRAEEQGWWARPCPTSLNQSCFERVECDGSLDVDYTFYGAPYPYCANTVDCSDDRPSDADHPCWEHEPCEPTEPPATMAPTRPPTTVAPTRAPTSPCDDAYEITPVTDATVNSWIFRRTDMQGWWLRPCESTPHCYIPTACDGSIPRNYSVMGAPYPWCHTFYECEPGVALPTGSHCWTHMPCGSTRPPTQQTRAPTRETRPPTDETRAPTQETRPPTGETRAPTQQTRAPTQQTRAPTQQTRAPTARPPTDSPVRCPANCGSPAFGGGTCTVRARDNATLCTSCNSNKVLEAGQCFQTVYCRGNRFASGRLVGERCRCATEHCFYCIKTPAGETCPKCRDNWYGINNTCVESCPATMASSGVSAYGRMCLPPFTCQGSRTISLPESLRCKCVTASNAITSCHRCQFFAGGIGDYCEACRDSTFLHRDTHTCHDNCSGTGLLSYAVGSYLRECRSPFTCTANRDEQGAACRCSGPIGKNSCRICDWGLTGTTTTNVCRQCQQGKFLHQGRCVGRCPRGYTQVIPTVNPSVGRTCQQMP
eukprot:m.1049321 g.1049321  ORF g.1049321 m.1049321 type:complete len:2024 (+) comp24173_c0_seq3:2-6073(+)